MTIFEYILDCELKSAEERLEKLKEFDAPTVIINGQESAIENLKAGKITISGDTDVLSDIYESREIKKGRGGKIYITINGNVNYFPNARYGRYIKKA